MVNYKTILADPPWLERGAGKIKRGADRHYPLMKTDDIIKYMKQIPIDDNAHLYLWTTNNFLKDGLRVVEELGFRYVTNVVWVKDRIGLGQYLRGQHELCLFAVKGKVPYKIIDGKRVTESSVINAKRTKHSKKPDEIYSKVEHISYPPFLEVFAREQRDGWDRIGNEVEETWDSNNKEIQQSLLKV